MKCDSVKIIDIVRIDLVELFAPFDDVESEVPGHIIPQHDTVRIKFFQKGVGGTQIPNIVLRHPDTDTRLVENLPYGNAIAPVFRHKIQITLEYRHRRIDRVQRFTAGFTDVPCDIFRERTGPVYQRIRQCVPVEKMHCSPDDEERNLIIFFQLCDLELHKGSIEFPFRIFQFAPVPPDANHVDTGIRQQTIGTGKPVLRNRDVPVFPAGGVRRQKTAVDSQAVSRGTGGMLHSRMHHQKWTFQGCQFPLLQLKFRKKRAEFGCGERNAADKQIARFPLQLQRESFPDGSVKRPFDSQHATNHGRFFRRKQRPDSQLHRSILQINLIPPIRHHDILAVIRRGSIGIFDPEIIEIKSIRRTVLRNIRSTDPDRIKATVRLHLECPGESLPLFGRSE